MKEIKAWAVVDKHGDLAFASDGLAAIFRSCYQATKDLDPECFQGERVVPVTITVEDE